MLTAFIDDGYNREARILPSSGNWPEILFTFRPMSASEASEFVAKSKNLDHVGWQKALARVVASKIVSWNVRNRSGEPVEPNEGNVFRIVPPLLLAFWKVINSEQPEGVEVEFPETVDDEKNSPAG